MVMTKNNSMVRISLEGTRLRLRPMQESDFPLLAQWRNDLTALLLGSDLRFLVPEHISIEELRKRGNYDKSPLLCIEEKESHQLIGTINLYGFDRDNNFAYLGLYISPAKRKLYFSLEATVIFINYVFVFFSLNKLYCDIMEQNHPAWRGVERLGFLREGEFKRHTFYDNQYWTMYRYALHREDLSAVKSFLERFQKPGVNPKQGRL